MAILTTIAGIPLFSTTQEAVAWAIANGISGFHVHNWQGQTGYMGGANHSVAIQAIRPTVTTTTTSTTSGGSGY